MTLKQKGFSPAFFWPVALATVIAVASGRSDVAGPSIIGIDKAIHFAVFGLLGTLVCRLHPDLRGAWLAWVAVSAFGAIDEWHQSFTPGRVAEVADWIADTLGAALGVALYFQWPRYRALLERPLFQNRRIENPALVTTISGS